MSEHALEIELGTVHEQLAKLRQQAEQLRATLAEREREIACFKNENDFLHGETQDLLKRAEHAEAALRAIRQQIERWREKAVAFRQKSAHLPMTDSTLAYARGDVWDAAADEVLALFPPSESQP